MREVPWLDREYVKSAATLMRQYGMGIKDAVFAAAAGSYMLALDHACMPAGVPPIIVEYNVRPHTRIIARYHFHVPSRPKLRERYEIFVPGFADRMYRACEEHRLTRDDLGTQWDVTTMVMALAGHEVRHRLDRRAGIRCFKPSDQPGSGVLLQGVVAVLAEKFKEERERLEKTPKGRILARMFHGEGEFDARVIERMIVHRGPACATVDDLAHLVLLEPTL